MHFLAGVDIGYVVSIICFLSPAEKDWEIFDFPWTIFCTSGNARA